MLRRVVVVILGLAVLGYLFASPMLRSIGRFLVNDEPPAAADAIVVLSGSIPDRILEAVALYREGLAPRIIVSRGRNPPGFDQLEAMGVHVPQVWDLNRSIAEQLGVPGDAIEEIGGSEDSTVDEAQLVLRYALAHREGVLLIVTSKYHSRRASIIYRYLAREHVRIISRPSRYDDFDPERWWHDRTFRRRVVIEYQKMLAFELLDRWQFAPVGFAARLVTRPA